MVELVIMMRANIINRQTGTTFGRSRQVPVPTALFTVAGCAKAHKLLGRSSKEAESCYHHTTCAQCCSWQLMAMLLNNADSDCHLTGRVILRRSSCVARWAIASVVAVKFPICGCNRTIPGSFGTVPIPLVTKRGGGTPHGRAVRPRQGSAAS